MVGRKVGEIRLENLFFNARKVYLECCAVGVIHWSLLSFFALLAAGWYLSG